MIPSVLALAAIAAVGTAPMWLPVWDQIMPGPKVVVDSAMRKEAVDTLAAKLNDHYIFPDKAKQIAAFLHQRRNEGQYDGITDGEQLAQRLTDDLQSIANDKHMEVVFSPRPVPPDDEGGRRRIRRPDGSIAPTSSCAVCCTTSQAGAWKRSIIWARTSAT